MLAVFGSDQPNCCVLFVDNVLQAEVAARAVELTVTAVAWELNKAENGIKLDHVDCESDYSPKFYVLFMYIHLCCSDNL